MHYYALYRAACKWYWLWALQQHTRTPQSSTLTLQPRHKQWSRYWSIVALWRVSNESKRNFLKGDTSHVTPNRIALTNKIIKVMPSYICGGVYYIWWSWYYFLQIYWTLLWWKSKLFIFGNNVYFNLYCSQIKLNETIQYTWILEMDYYCR